MDMQEIVTRRLMPTAETEATILAGTKHYLFYKRFGKWAMFRCSACGNAGDIPDATGLRHGGSTLCPACMEQVEAIAAGRIRSGRTLADRFPAIWFRANEDGLWAAGAMVELYFYKESGAEWDWRPDIDYQINYVWHWGEEAESWKYDGWWNMYMYRERASEPAQSPFHQQGYYVFQTDEIMKSNMQHCAIDLYKGGIADKEWRYGVIRYLTAYKKRPALELAVKWGLDDVAEEWVENRRVGKGRLNWKAKTPWEFLKIQKSDWSPYRKSHYANTELLRANRQTFHMDLKKVIEICDQLGNTDRWLSNAEKIADDYEIPLEEQMKYLRKQDGMVTALRNWRDYLDMCAECGRDLTDYRTRFPRQLNVAHDEMVQLRRAMRMESEARRLGLECKGYREKRLPKLRKKYEYTSGGLRIRVPESAAEIINAGNVLKICVGGYAKRHLDGVTDILFLERVKRPGVPYVCIEMRNGVLIQIHGYKNERVSTGLARSPLQKHDKFMQEWLAWVEAGSHKQKKKMEATA